MSKIEIMSTNLGQYSVTIRGCFAWNPWKSEFLLNWGPVWFYPWFQTSL